ncbi:unnamed protein product [Ectocarpus sp. 12 AP-2014]
MSGSRKRLRSPIVVSRAACATVVCSSIMLLALSENQPRNHQQQHPKQVHSSRSSRISSTQISSMTKLSFFIAASAATSAEEGTRSNIATVPATPREPFVDDGMFDPRRDYWGNSSRTVAQSGATTPAGSNWVAAAHRGLASTSSNCGPASSSDPCCIECFGLSYCDVLNGYKVEDKYFPGEATILGSCENFEDRASRLEVFGPSKTFRDTDACREMVIDYTCLWWGSANEMYDNRCGIEAQVYPCRSYCVQLAKTCANNVVEWQELCRSIDCPPTDEECMPGPYSQAREATQDPDEACYLYEYHSPLNAATPRGKHTPGVVAAVAVASMTVVAFVIGAV